MSRVQYNLYLEDINTSADKSVHFDFELLTAYVGEEGTELDSMSIPLSLNMTEELEFLLEQEDPELRKESLQAFRAIQHKFESMIEHLENLDK
tara:strand:+ start:921 stop:1199 length:279 start_codon:yes stop_codon:yes gene_type:complete